MPKVRTLCTAVVMAIIGSALVLGTTPPAVGSTVPAEPQPHAMWVWSADAPTDLVAFATGHDVTRMYVFVTYDPDRAERDRLHELGRLASANGIVLWAMSGEPGWALKPKVALAWQRDALRLGIFAGTHLDVEPYAMHRWKTDRARVVRGYLHLLDRMQKASALPLHVAVPFWYGTIATADGNLADDVLARVDGVTVMSYRDSATGPNSLSAVAEDMLVRGDATGVPVELAVETNPLPSCPTCTFDEEGEAAMLHVVSVVDDLERPTHPSYDGFAVEDFDGWRDLSD